MLSRVAERVYWMARYAERAENTARIINVYTNLLLDLPRNLAIGWHPLVDITGTSELFDELISVDSERNIVRFLMADQRNPASIINSLVYARENARTIRDIIPREGWEQINDLYLQTKAQLPTALSRRNRYEFLSFLIGGVQRLTGLLAGTMTHNHGYHFVRIGRNLERADMTSRILDTMSVNLFPKEHVEVEALSYILWMSILNSLSAYQSYRQEVQTAVTHDSVVKFILHHRNFPRAIYHCLCEIQNSLQQLPRHMRSIRYINRVMRKIEHVDVSELQDKHLRDFMDELQRNFAMLNAVLASTYFDVSEKKPKPVRRTTAGHKKKGGSKPVSGQAASEKSLATV